MPALPDYPNVLKVEVLWTVGADVDVSSRTHFTYSGTAPSSTTCAAIALAIYNLTVTDLVPLIANENAFRGISVTDLTSPTSGYGEYLEPTPGTRGSGDSLPAEVCALWNMQMLRRYRGGKPRVYWPFGIGSDILSPSAWESSSVTAFEVGLNNWFAAIQEIVSSGTTLVALCSVSYYEGFTTVLNPITGRTRDVPKVRSVAIAPDIITDVFINPKPGAQRRRQQHSP